MKFIFFLFIVFFCLSSCRVETVRVNIIGYPKLNYFEIILNSKSKVFIDNNHINPHNLKFFPKKNLLKLDNENTYKKFNKIIINTNGIINISCKHGTQSYKGIFEITNNDQELQMINEINLDDYLASVLGSEMGGAFSDETLKAQSIAIRTYYYSRKKEYKNKNYDINNADGRDMVYRGNDFAYDKMYKILDETENIFLINKNGKLILPLFHSTSCGIILKDSVMKSNYNDDNKNPVLLDDIDDNGIPLSADSPYYNFTIKLTNYDLLKITKPVLDLNTIIDVKLKYFNNTECVDFIGFIDEKNKTHWIKCYKFLSLAQRNNYNNLRSIQFNINKSYDEYIFTGKGFGHLCGMSQYSAEKLSKNGYDFKMILKKYYPDASIKRKNIFLIINNLDIFY